MHRGSSSILLATFFKHPVESLHFKACNPFSFLKLALLSTGMMPWIYNLHSIGAPPCWNVFRSSFDFDFDLDWWLQRWLWKVFRLSRPHRTDPGCEWVSAVRRGNQWMRPKCTESKWQLYTVHVIVQWQSWLREHCTDSALSKCNVLRFLKLHPQ